VGEITKSAMTISRSAIPGISILFFTFGTLLSSCFSDVSENAVAFDTSQVIHRIAFGSGVNENEPNPMWPVILGKDPNLFLWLGGMVHKAETNPAKMDVALTIQKLNPNYKLIRQGMPILGVWSDRDYGLNQGGKQHPTKDSIKRKHLDFLDIPKNRKVWERPGVFDTYTFGPEAQKVRVILLDTRYFRDDIPIDSVGLDTADLLGQQQWIWLDSVLRTSEAKVNVLASGIDFFPENHSGEKWGDFPLSKKRLIELVNDYKPRNPIFLSGGRHLAEISRIQFDSVGHPVYEITSGTMNFEVSNLPPPRNKLRVGKAFRHNNIGLIEILWEDEKINFEIIDDQGKKVIERSTKLYNYPID
jgi:alkaline phosphatase D